MAAIIPNKKRSTIQRTLFGISFEQAWISITSQNTKPTRESAPNPSIIQSHALMNQPKSCIISSQSTGLPFTLHSHKEAHEELSEFLFVVCSTILPLQDDREDVFSEHRISNPCFMHMLLHFRLAVPASGEDTLYCSRIWGSVLLILKSEHSVQLSPFSAASCLCSSRMPSCHRVWNGNVHHSWLSLSVTVHKDVLLAAKLWFANHVVVSTKSVPSARRIFFIKKK